MSLSTLMQLSTTVKFFQPDPTWWIFSSFNSRWAKTTDLTQTDESMPFKINKSNSNLHSHFWYGTKGCYGQSKKRCMRTQKRMSLEHSSWHVYIDFIWLWTSLNTDKKRSSHEHCFSCPFTWKIALSQWALHQANTTHQTR